MRTFFYGHVGLKTFKDNKISIKGISKSEPNIYYKTLYNLLYKKNDSVLDEFFDGTKTNILDWCLKSDDGKKISIILSNIKLDIPSSIDDDLSGLSKYSDKINRDKYFNHMNDVIEKFFRYLIIR